ncbi:unnamed protein product [Ectocarpus fasciculatus]
MVNVRSRRCGHPGCVKQTSYGKPGSKSAEFCHLHREPGMINVKRA